MTWNTIICFFKNRRYHLLGTMKNAFYFAYSDSDYEEYYTVMAFCTGNGKRKVKIFGPKKPKSSYKKHKYYNHYIRPWLNGDNSNFYMSYRRYYVDDNDVIRHRIIRNGKKEEISNSDEKVLYINDYR